METECLFHRRNERGFFASYLTTCPSLDGPRSSAARLRQKLVSPRPRAVGKAAWTAVLIPAGRTVGVHRLPHPANDRRSREQLLPGGHPASGTPSRTTVPTAHPDTNKVRGRGVGRWHSKSSSMRAPSSSWGRAGPATSGFTAGWTGKPGVVGSARCAGVTAGARASCARLRLGRLDEVVTEARLPAPAPVLLLAPPVIGTSTWLSGPGRSRLATSGTRCTSRSAFTTRQAPARGRSCAGRRGGRSCPPRNEPWRETETDSGVRRPGGGRLPPLGEMSPKESFPSGLPGSSRNGLTASSAARPGRREKSSAGLCARPTCRRWEGWERPVRAGRAQQNPPAKATGERT